AVNDDGDDHERERYPEGREDVVDTRAYLADRVARYGEHVDRADQHSLACRARHAVGKDERLVGEESDEDVLGDLAEAVGRLEAERVEVAAEPDDPREHHQEAHTVFRPALPGDD